jgi:uncharacterized protein YlxW (UPF0749 family)
MAAWLPIVKTAIPVIAQIVNIAAPMLTKKSVNTDRETLLAQQIEELQNAATQNSESVKALAAQVQTTFEGIESAAVALQKRLDRQQKLSVVAATFGLCGISLSLYVLLGG